MFTYKDNGEANLWVIMYNNNWYMTIRFNGELMESRQIRRLEQIIHELNNDL